MSTFFVCVAVTPLALAVLATWWFRRRRRASSAGLGSLLIGNVLVLAVLASIAFLGVETTYRFAYDTTNSFGFGLVHERWFERHWHRNESGVRDDVEYARPLDPTRRRVTFIGDSFTAGHGIDDVADRFANVVRASRPKWDVQVMAHAGADTPQTTESVQTLIDEGYGLDLVVLVTCLNDIGPADPRGYDVIHQVYDDLPPDGFWMRNSFAVNTISHRLRVLSAPESASYFDFVRDSYTGSVWTEQRRRLDDLTTRIVGAGGRLGVVTFPFLHALDGEYPYRSAHGALTTHWRERGVPHLDLLPTFHGRASADLVVNPFDAHPNEAAHALAAEAIEAFVARQFSDLGAPGDRPR